VNTLDGSKLTTVKNTTNNNNYGVSVGLYKFKEKKFDVNYNVDVRYNTSKSTVNPLAKTNYYTHNHNLYINVTLPFKFEINSSVEANFRQKTDLFTGNNNVVLWNGHFGRKLLKNDKALISIRAYDILDQNRGYDRTISSTILREDTYDTLRRYFMLSFTWNFSKNPGGAAPSN
jgi:hypothetical protein